MGVENPKEVTVERLITENYALKQTIAHMAPMWLMAMGFAEHGKPAIKDRMIRYYNNNPMTQHDIKIMFEQVPGKES